MEPTTLLTSLLLTTTIHAFPHPPMGPQTPFVNISTLVPAFGVIPNTDRDVLQPGSCAGFNGVQRVPIPCSCPPDRGVFIAALESALGVGNVFGDAISFSANASDQSPETNRARATACVIVLQSFNGRKGDGCPAAAAPNFKTQQVTGVRSEEVFVG